MITRGAVPWFHAVRMSVTNCMPTEVMSWTVHEEEPCEILIDVDFNLASGRLQRRQIDRVGEPYPHRHGVILRISMMKNENENSSHDGHRAHAHHRREVHDDRWQCRRTGGYDA